MIDVGFLNKKVELYEYETQSDGYGGYTKELVLKRSVFANFEEIGRAHV